MKGGRRSAPLRADPRQKQKLNEPFEERGGSAGTSVQMPGSGWQSPGLRRGTSALPALCKGSQEIWTPRKVVAAASWCGQELSARLSRIGAFAGRAHLHVLGVVLETLDDIGNRFALIADLIYSCEEGEPTGKMDKISPCCIARAPPLLLCHAGPRGKSRWDCSVLPHPPGWMRALQSFA